ncbi:MAG: glycosyltransferase family 39 protein, partial [Caldilinea sp.]
MSIVVQALDFGPALCGVLGFVALTGWMLWFRFGDLFGDARRQVTILAIAGILGLGFIGYLGLGFALAGWFSASRFFGVWALVMMLLAADGWRRGRWPAHLAQWRFAQPLPIYFWLLISLWLLLYIRPFDLVIGGRDPGVYVNTAAQIAEQGGLAVLDPFLADLTPAIQEQLVWHPVWLKDFIPYKWPGFFWMGNSSARPGMVLPQFFHMYPALMAPFYAMLGYRGALTILPVIMLVFALVLAEMAWLLLQSRLSGRDELAKVTPPSLALTIGSLLPPLFLLLNPAMYWFGRFANADVLYGLFVFAAVFFWARAAEVRNQGWLNWPLALLCFGAALLTKIDSFYLLPGAVLTAQVFHPARRERHRWAQWLAWGAVCGVYLAAVYGFSYPYVLSTLRSSGFWVSTQRAEAVWIAIGYLMIVTAAGLTTPLLAADRLERWRTRWRLPAASLALAVAVACLLSLTILVVAMPNRVRLV